MEFIILAAIVVVLFGVLMSFEWFAEAVDLGCTYIPLILLLAAIFALCSTCST